MTEASNSFKETKIGPIPVDWEVVRLAQAKVDVELDVVIVKLGFEEGERVSNPLARDPELCKR